jgi:hypothetical protein
MKSERSTEVQTIDPLTDPRWPEFLASHPHSSAFHTREWLMALRDTYHYQPIVFTSGAENHFSNGVLFCTVRSWLTGDRLVSLPFSDHCAPLASGDDLTLILRAVQEYRKANNYRYTELRPALAPECFGNDTGFDRNEEFTLHTIDLRPDLDAIYRRFHDSCIRRKIKRAERENLTIEVGNSKELLQKFRHLLLLTRRRHKLPPQPARWFENLAHSFGDKLKIYLLSKDGIPAASILTICHKRTLMYKYGCSDAKFHNLGGMPFLFWRAIRDAKEAGMEYFDLGRSSGEDPGLLAFKGHLGGTAVPLQYYRDRISSSVSQGSSKSAQWVRTQWVRTALARLPDPLLVSTGNLLYRHLG